MKVRSLVALGYVAVMAAIGLGTASGSVAAEAHHAGLMEERVGHGGSIYSSNQTTAMQSNPCAAAQGNLVEERIGHGGSVYVRPAARPAVN